MEFDIGVIKRHPYLLGGIVLIVGGYIFYRIYKGSASTSDLSSEAQFQALQSAQQLQNSQIQGQLDLQSGQANAQIAVIGASYQGQIDLAKQGQSVYDDYLATQLALAEGSNTTTIQVAQIQSNTAIGTTQIQADVLNQQTEAQLAAYQGELAFRTDVADKILSGDYLRKAESTGRSQVVAALFKTGVPSPQSYTSGSTKFSIGIPGVGSLGVGAG
jgi:hypothetical protein